MPDPTGEPAPKADGRAPTISTLAIVATVLAFIPLCPPVNALGAVLGIMAWRRIRESGGRLTGSRLSIVAIIGGLLLSITTLWAAQAFATWQQKVQDRDMAMVLDGFLRNATAGDHEAARAGWSDEDVPLGEDAIERFGEELTAALGAFESVRIGTSEPVSGPSLLEIRVNCWIIVRFEDGEHNGSARFAMKTMMNEFTLTPLLIDVRIETGDGVEFTLPRIEEDDEP